MKSILKIVISFTLLFLVCSTIAQTRETDYLIKSLKNAKEDTAKVHLYIKLFINYRNVIGDNDTAWYYAQEAKKLSEKINYEIGLAKSNNNLGIVNFDKGNYAEALRNYLESLKIWKKIGDKKGISLLYNNIGNVHYAQGNYSNALNYHFKAVKLEKQTGDKLQLADSYNSIGVIYEMQGNYPEALHFYFRALKILEEIKDKQGIATMNNNIGVIHETQGNNAQALNYYFKSLEIYKAINDKEGIGDIYNNIGVIHENQKELKEALKYYFKSLKIWEELNNKSGISYSYHNIGLIYKMQNKYSEALNYFLKSLQILEEINDLHGMADSYFNIGDVYLQTHKPKLAKEWYEKALKISLEIGAKEQIQNSYAGSAKADSALHNFKGAFENYKMYIFYRNDLLNDENIKKLTQTEMQFEFDKRKETDSLKNAKEKEIQNIKIDKQQAEIEVKQNQQYFLIIGLVLVVVFAVFMVNRFKVTQRQKIIIEEKEKETEKQKLIIEEKHKEITDSINYAERIQKSFLATKELLDENLGEYFVYFQPKDVVSGDFYWASELNNGNFILACADSTGHGVPGAIMSILNISSLEKSIETNTEPAEILNATRKIIIERLKKDGSAEGGKDGMDASLIVLNKSKTKMSYAAANNPIWVIRNSEIIELLPDKMPVGKHEKDKHPFTQHEFEIRKGDIIYLFTDGYADQFGGPRGKKFNYLNLKKLFLENTNENLATVNSKLASVFNNWKGDLEQVDDVCVIGIRI